MLTLSDIRWAAEECERQQSGELSVSHLCNALQYAQEVRQVNGLLDIEEIKIIGRLVEPDKNKRGFRQVPVTFNGIVGGLTPGNIELALTRLSGLGDHLTPTEWYTEFEKIHPFIDGNGRVGSILFNWKNGTLKDPVSPPDVFSQEKHTI